jgi:hypothetical protein
MRRRPELEALAQLHHKHTAHSVKGGLLEGMRKRSSVAQRQPLRTCAALLALRYHCSVIRRVVATCTPGVLHDAAAHCQTCLKVVRRGV